MSTLTKSVFLNLPKIFLTIVYFWALFNQKSPIALAAIVVLIIAIDIADGKIAVRETKSRRLVDSLTDKVIVNCIFLTTVLYYKLSFWSYIPLCARDAVIILGAIYLTKRQVVIFPNLLHKMAMLSIAIAGICVVSGLHSARLLAGMYCLCFIAFLDYFGLFLIFRNTRNKTYHPTIFQGLKKLLGIA